MSVLRTKIVPQIKNIDLFSGAVWLAIVLVNAFGLILCFNQVYGYDEAYTVALASKNIKEIIEATSQDVHTPFYYVMLHLLCGLTGVPMLFMTKFLSLIFYDLYLWVGSSFIKGIYDKKISGYWLLFSALMPPMIIQVANGRMYTIGLFFVTASIALAYKCYTQNEWKYWVLFTLSSACGVYVHTFTMIALFFVYVLLAIVIVVKKKYSQLRGYLLSGGAVALVYIPWLIVLYHQMARWSGYEEGWANTLPPVSLSEMKLWVYEWFSIMERPQVGALVFGIAVLILSLYHAVRYSIANKDAKPFVGIGLGTLIVTIATVIGLVLVPCFYGRYIFCLFGAIYLLFAVGLRQCSAKWIQTAICIGLFVVGAFAIADKQDLDKTDGLKQYQQFMDKFLEEDDIIMCDTYFGFVMSIYYPDNEYMIYGSKPSSIPFECTVFTSWEQLEGVDDFWYIQLEGLRAGDLSAQFEEWDCLRFEHSHYTILLKQMVRKTE